MNARRTLFTALFILAGICSLLALVESLYKPILELPFMSYLIAPSEYRNIAASLHSDGFKNQVALTFYNPDYFGGFCALLFPVTLSFIPLSPTKTRKIISTIVSILFLIALLLSRSSGATYSAIVSLVLLLLIYRHKLLSRLPNLFLLAAAAAVLFIGVQFASGGRFFSSLSGNLTNKTTSQNTKEKFVLRDLYFDGNTLTLTDSDHKISIQAVDNCADLTALRFSDENNLLVQPSQNSDGLYFEDQRFKDIRLSLQQQTLIIDLGYKDTIEFYITSDGFKAIGQNGEPLNSIPSLNPPLKNLYGIATGRGYTWVNSLPILKDCLFLGKGPDSFVFSFPQNDIVGLLNTHESAKFVVDKPHNFYLQTGINTGGISLLALILIFVLYLIRGFRRYWKNISDTMGIGIYSGILAFLIIGLVNDSMVVVNPLFWLLLGVGYASL